MTVLADPYVDWASMWQILLISVGAGAGLVTIYAVGLLALSASGYLRPREATAASRHVSALVAAVLCLVVVVGAAVYGIHVIFAKG